MTSPSRPTRASADGRAYLDLQNLARRQNRPTDELHQLYALEGFLARLAASPYSASLVLKGGVLLAAYDARRPTRDIDMQARIDTADTNRILQIVREIATLPADDGLQFDAAHAAAHVIRDEDESTGVRVTLNASLSTAKLSLHVDINVGDPVWPAPREIDLPKLLGGSITLIGYPLVMVHAEKIITALQRATINTRWRDFADVYVLTGRHRIDGDELHRALSDVGAYRRVQLAPLAGILVGYAELAQSRWAAWRRKQQLEQRLPAQFAEVLDAVITFADPALRHEVNGQHWHPQTARWAW